MGDIKKILRNVISIYIALLFCAVALFPIILAIGLNNDYYYWGLIITFPFSLGAFIYYFPVGD